MPSNFDRLRAGEVVEYKPGVRAWLNFENKKLELSTGQEIDATDDRDFFPENDEDLKRSKEKETLKKSIKSSPAGEFLYQFGNQGIVGAGQDWYNKITQKGEDYARTKQIRGEVSQKISKESPWTSAGATAASLVPDIALTRGMSAARAAPTLAVAHAGPRVLEEPGQVATEALFSGIGGKLIDKGAGALSKIAQRRGEIRSLPGRQEAVKDFNVKGQAAVNQTNTAQSQLYQKALKDLPELQNQAQKAFSGQVIKHGEDIANSFPKKARIYSSNLGVGEFIDDSINRSALAGSKEASAATKILKALFPEGRELGVKELARSYKSLEGAIQRSSPEVRQVLSDFKVHLGNRLQPALADNMAFERLMPTLTKQVTKQVEGALRGIGLPKTGEFSQGFFEKKAKENLTQLFKELTPEDFIKKFQSGEIKDKILGRVLQEADFLPASRGIPPEILKKLPDVKNITKSYEYSGNNPFTNAPSGGANYEKFKTSFTQKLEAALDKAELKLIGTELDAARRLGSKVKKTQGLVQPLPPPVQPTPQAFTPVPQPVLPPAQGLSDRAGDFLEKDLLGGKGLVNNPLTKLAGLKYVLGKAAVPAEIGYLGMKGLTSPTGAGEVARATFKQGGIQAIDQWAQSYPSYHNGILDNPQERRALTKQIEDDQEIPLEQKALIQSKVNRGKPIAGSL